MRLFQRAPAVAVIVLLLLPAPAQPAAADPDEPLSFAPQPTPFPAAMSPVWCVVVSPDGRTVAVSSGGFSPNPGALSLYDLATGAELGSRYEHVGVRSVAYSPDGKTLA